MNKKEWNQAHSLCPSCFSSSVSKTNKMVKLKGVDYMDDVNSATCDSCGWKGMVKQLTGVDVSENVGDVVLNTGDVTVSIRTVDYDGCVYVNVDDSIGSVIQWNDAMSKHLASTNELKNDEVMDAINIACKQIVSMLAMTAHQHVQTREK